MNFAPLIGGSDEVEGDRTFHNHSYFYLFFARTLGYLFEGSRPDETRHMYSLRIPSIIGWDMVEDVGRRSDCS